MDKKKVQIALLAVLLVVFAGTLMWAFKPKKTIATIPSGAAGQKTSGDYQPGIAQDVNLVTLEDSLAKVQASVGEIGKKMNQPIAPVNNDPFTQPGKGLTGVPVNPDVPVFMVSGIVYDKVKPFAVIDNEVKGENEFKAGFLVYRIMKDQVLLKKKNKIFVLKVNSSEPMQLKDGIIQLSDNDGADVESALVRVDTPVISMKTILKEPSAAKAAARVEMPSPILVKRDGNVSHLTSHVSRIEDTSHDATQPVVGVPSIEGAKNDQPKIKTVQVASYGAHGADQAVKMARKLAGQGFEDARAECIDGVYTVRVGKFEDGKEARDIYRELKKIAPGCLVRTAYYIEERVVYPDNG